MDFKFFKMISYHRKQFFQVIFADDGKTTFLIHVVQYMEKNDFKSIFQRLENNFFDSRYLSIGTQFFNSSLQKIVKQFLESFCLVIGKNLIQIIFSNLQKTVFLNYLFYSSSF